MKQEYTSIPEIIKIPNPHGGLEHFSQITKKNIQDIFAFEANDPDRSYGLELFMTNSDHGAEHVYNVYKKAAEIARIVEEKTGEKADQNILYVMIALHDSGRFHIQAPQSTDTQQDTIRKDKKAKNADNRHMYYGVSQMRFGLKKLEKKGIIVDPDIINKISEYVYNHDYMTPELNGDRFHEPSSLEGQIARLADRISTPAIPELERYRATGKRLGTPFYNKNISFEDRKNFTFTQTGQYIKTGKLDQCMFFATLLAVKSKDFSHPILQEIYKQRIPEKKEAVERIFSLAKEEGIDEKTIHALKKTMTEYSKIYEFDF